MDFANRQPADRLSGLDALRLVAAVMVVAFHWLYRGAVDGGYIAVRYETAAPFAEIGYLGVNLFFLISGYVITRSAQGRNMPTFFVARFARLYPGHLACMTITFLILWSAAIATMPVSGVQWLANLTMFAPAFGQPFMDGVYWSIVLELIFYGWIALAIAAGVLERYTLRIVAVWLAICALNEIWLQSGAARMLLLTEYGPLFAFGIVAQYWRERQRSKAAFGLALAAFALSCHTLTVTQGWMLDHYGQAPGYGTLLVANAALHAGFLAALAIGNSPGSPRMWAGIGGITYALYLLHQYIGYAIIELAAPTFGRWPALGMAALVVLALSIFVWRHIEKPAGARLRHTGNKAIALWKREAPNGRSPVADHTQ